MTFLFLDKVAAIVGEPAALVAEARARLFHEPVRHEGLRRLPRDEVRSHVAGVVVRVANDKLRQPLMDAVSEHARDAGDTHTMMTGDELGSEGYVAAVIAAFEGNDVGIDMAALVGKDASPEAVADQVLVSPEDPFGIVRACGVEDESVDAVVDEILAPAPVEWSLQIVADMVADCMQGQTSGLGEGLRYLFGEADENLRETAYVLLQITPAWCGRGLNEWLDERAVFSSPESDEADVAEVLRLINEKGGGSHSRRDDVGSAADMTAAGVELCEVCGEPVSDTPSGTVCNNGHGGADTKPASAAAPDLTPHPTETREVTDVDGTTLYIPSMEAHERSAARTAARKAAAEAPVAAEPSDVTRAVAGALKALFELTKETDTHVAEVLGVPKAVVAQARKDITPWAPDPRQLARLHALVGRYNDGLAAALGGLGALGEAAFASEENG